MYSGAWWWATALLVIDVVIHVLAIIIVPRHRWPTAGMARLLAIFPIPYVGVISFLLIGSPKLPRKRRMVQAEINDFMRAAWAEDRSLATQKKNPAWSNSLVEMNRTYGVLPLIGGERRAITR